MEEEERKEEEEEEEPAHGGLLLAQVSTLPLQHCLQAINTFIMIVYALLLPVSTWT